MDTLEPGPWALTQILIPGPEAPLPALETWAVGSSGAAPSLILWPEGCCLRLSTSHFPLPFLQGYQVLAATYNQAAQLWKVGEAQSKVRPDWGGCLGVRGSYVRTRGPVMGSWPNS